METRAAGCCGPKNPRGARETSTTHTNAVFAHSTTRTRSPDPFGDPSSTSGVSAPPILSMFSYLNIRGLVPQTVPSKVPYIKDELEDTSGVAFAITETWLNDTHLDAELYIDGYSLFRKDRIRKKSKSTRSSGGVGIYIRDDHAISAETIFSFTNGVIESLGIHVMSLNLILLVTYRSPDNCTKTKDGKSSGIQHRSTSKEFKAYLDELKKLLVSLPTPTPDILLMGDFNLPHADWLTGECSSGADKEEQMMVKCLYELSLEHFLIQNLDCPTHKDGNMIDLVFTNNSDLIHNLTVIPAPNSDHYLINCSAVYSRATEPKENEPENNENRNEECSFHHLNFFDDTVNWDSLCDELSQYNWTREFRGMDTTSMMNRFTSVCLQIAQKWVPVRKAPPHAHHNRPKIPRHRRALMRRRTRLKKRYISAKTEVNRQALLQKLIHIEKDLQKSHCDQRELEERRAIEKIKTNPKFFFTFGKKFSKIKIGVGPLMNTAKKLIAAPTKMAEMLSDQYSSVFSTPYHDDPSPWLLFPDEEYTQSDICDIEFTDYEMAEAMDELTTNAAPGPDGFPAILLKKCRNALAPPLAKIWRKSMLNGEIPDICKSATIIPIHKGKSRAVPKNYRPVALTSHLIKIFEKVVRKQIVDFMQANDLFNYSQHGFRGGRSCLSQLLCHFDRITSELENGKGVDVVYLDFAKAFDKVDHGITLRKLKLLGIKGQLGRWICSFLTNRVQSVLVEGKKSKPKPVTSGVPQGSVLGPLLFLVLIGDIDKTVASSFLSSFADDTRVGKGIASEEDIHNLQADLEAIYKWSVDNNMTFNSDKFELLRYKSKSSKELQASTSYSSDNGSIIEEKLHVRDLGVTLSNTATFSQHIHEKCIAVKSKISWVLRTFKTRESLPMLTLWKTQIMCHLDYCSQLWSPKKTGDIQSLELLQKAFVRNIRGMSALSYWDQLIKLKLYSLERRRERYQVIYTWRIIEGHVPNFDCTPIQSYKNSRRGRECRVPPISSSAPCAIQTIRSSALPVKGPRLFNVLPKNLRNMSGCTTERFKCELDRYLATVPDEPLVPGLTQYRRCDSNSVIDWANSPYLHQQDNQLQQHNYLELDEAVTTWRPVGSHKHYRVIPSEW